MAYTCRRAISAPDILCAQRIRRLVFGAGYLDPRTQPTCYEHDPWDRQPQTQHLLLEQAGVVVGTARLIFGRGEAGYPQMGYGLPLERYVDLTPLASRHMRCAEIGRVCVLAEHRGRGAARSLYRAAAQICHGFGIERWVGAANTETALGAEAAAIEQLITERALWADVRCPLRITRADASVRPAAPIPPRLPPILQSYVRWGAIRFLAPPVYDTVFNRYAIAFTGETHTPIERILPADEPSAGHARLDGDPKPDPNQPEE